VGRGSTFANEWHPSYSSGSLPASNASPVSPRIIMLTGQSRPFIFATNPSYTGLTLDKLVMVIAIRTDTFILLSVIRYARTYY
jgi:hypothetical protein